MNRLYFLENLEKHFCNLTHKKTNFVKHTKIYRNIYRKNLSAIVYRLPISLQEIEIYRSSLSPMAFLKLSIIALAQKGLSCPTLVSSKLPESHRNYRYCYCIKNKSKLIHLRTTAIAHCSLARYRCRAEKHSYQEIFRLKEISWYLVCMSLVGWIEKAARSASVFFLKTF